MSVDLSALTMDDSNFDGNVNILDIVLLVDAILGFHEPDSLEMYSSDLNSDGVLNILDVIALVNVILGD